MTAVPLKKDQIIFFDHILLIILADRSGTGQDEDQFLLLMMQMVGADKATWLDLAQVETQLFSTEGLGQGANFTPWDWRTGWAPSLT